MKAAIVMTLNCDNRCMFCSHHFREEPLSEREIKEIEVKALRDAKTFRRLGYREIEISGSDPLQYEKIASMVEWLRSIGFTRLEILTHGRNLSDAELVKALNDAGMDALRIPLYGPDAEIHDSVTKSKGSFIQTVMGIENLMKFSPDIKLTLTTLVLKQNAGKLLQMAKFFSRYTEDMAFGYPHLRSKINHKEFAMPLGEIKEELISLVELREQKGWNIRFLDIPYCVFGFYRDYIENTNEPPKTSGNSGVPDYRIKVKNKSCCKCRLYGKCDGFLKTYVELFGFGDFSPL